MNIFRKSTPIDDTSDASLVMASLRGNRDAFGKIVTRYQRLLCSLAYSSVGDLSHSEDIAQEAFVEAWKKLDTLRDPEKLKSWLCGILRFKVSRFRRKEAKQPVKNADEIGELTAYESEQASAEDAAMREEEQALLWQALEKVPETYREPLILFYREHRSVEHVACELDLSESAVKQRLSRGRKLLQEGMMSFVEDALSKSSPTTVFTAGVLTAISIAAPPAKAAMVGATAIHVGSWFKWATVVTFLATVSGLLSSFFALRANLDQSRTKRERREVVKTVILFLGIAIIFVVGMFGLRYAALHEYGSVGYYSVAAQTLPLAFAASYAVLLARGTKKMRALRAAERKRQPNAFMDPVDQPGSKKREYRSRMTLFGVPLVHVKFAMSEEGETPAVGWVAAGEVAYGYLFAWGGYAVAPVSVGIISVGLVTVGAVGIGIVSMGTVGIGVLAMGASAIGYKAYASLSAMGWESAFSQGFSVAKEAAIGPISIAKQVNNEMAVEIANLATVDQTYVLALGVVALLVIVPVVWYSNAVRKKMRKIEK